MVYQKGSVLGPLLFNIFLSDLIYLVESTDIVNYAGDTLPYSATECVIEKLRHLSSSLFKWYSSNCMKVNGGKSHIVMSGKQMMIANIFNNELASQSVEELLGIDIDSALTFESHINKICKKVIL